MNLRTNPSIGKKWIEAFDSFSLGDHFVILRHPGDFTGWRTYSSYSNERNARREFEKLNVRSGAACLLDHNGICIAIKKASDYDKEEGWVDNTKVIKGYVVDRVKEERRKIMNLKKEIRSILKEQQLKLDFPIDLSIIKRLVSEIAKSIDVETEYWTPEDFVEQILNWHNGAERNLTRSEIQQLVDLENKIGEDKLIAFTEKEAKKALDNL